MLPLEKSYEAETGRGVEYSNPKKTDVFFQWLVGFVDDNTFLIKLEKLGYQNPNEVMLKEAKRCMEIWQRLVHITGGELELTKSRYAIMAWQLKERTEKLCSIEEAPGMISLRSDKYEGLEVKLSRNKVETAERQLRVRLTLTGSDTVEYLHQLQQSKTLAGKINASPFSRNDSETIYRERWIPAVGYCLPVTKFTKK